MPYPLKKKTLYLPFNLGSKINHLGLIFASWCRRVYDQATQDGCSLSLFFFWLHCTAWGILVPLLGIEPAPLAVKAQSPNHWTAREFPQDGCSLALCTSPARPVPVHVTIQST